MLPSTENSRNGHDLQTAYSPCPSDYEATDWQSAKRTPGWSAREPKFVHSVKWVDSDGLEHLRVVRSDDLDELLREIRALKQSITASRAKAQEEEQNTAPHTQPQEGWCPLHHVRMQHHTNGKGSWWSHKLADGTWCKGK